MKQSFSWEADSVSAGIDIYFKTRRFNIVSTRERHWTKSWSKLILSTSLPILRYDHFGYLVAPFFHT
jgi:hypothetical protein